MKPPKAPSRPPSGKTRAAEASTRGRPEPAPEVVMDIRHEPLGEDDKGGMYWYLVWVLADTQVLQVPGFCLLLLFLL